MKAILTDNTTKAVFATLNVDNVSLNATNAGTAIFNGLSLHLKGSTMAPLPSATASYQLDLEDDAGNPLASYSSVSFQNYSFVLNEGGSPSVVNASANSMAFKIN